MAEAAELAEALERGGAKDAEIAATLNSLEGDETLIKNLLDNLEGEEALSNFVKTARNGTSTPEEFGARARIGADQGPVNQYIKQLQNAEKEGGTAALASNIEELRNNPLIQGTQRMALDSMNELLQTSEGVDQLKELINGPLDADGNPKPPSSNGKSDAGSWRDTLKEVDGTALVQGLGLAGLGLWLGLTGTTPEKILRGFTDPLSDVAKDFIGAVQGTAEALGAPLSSGLRTAIIIIASVIGVVVIVVGIIFGLKNAGKLKVGGGPK